MYSTLLSNHTLRISGITPTLFCEYNTPFDAIDSFKWNGDTCYLGLFELNDDDQALFEKLTGEGGENIPEKFNNLQYLIQVLVNEELNTKL